MAASRLRRDKFRAALHEERFLVPTGVVKNGACVRAQDEERSLVAALRRDEHGFGWAHHKFLVGCSAVEK